MIACPGIEECCPIGDQSEVVGEIQHRDADRIERCEHARTVELPIRPARKAVTLMGWQVDDGQAAVPAVDDAGSMRNNFGKLVR